MHIDFYVRVRTCIKRVTGKQSSVRRCIDDAKALYSPRT